MLQYILLALGIVGAAGGYLGRRHYSKKLAATEAPSKQQKRPKTLLTILMVIGAYLTATSLITILFGRKSARRAGGFHLGGADQSVRSGPERDDRVYLDHYPDSDTVRRHTASDRDTENAADAERYTERAGMRG